MAGKGLRARGAGGRRAGLARGEKRGNGQKLTTSEKNVREGPAATATSGAQDAGTQRETLAAPLHVCDVKCIAGLALRASPKCDYHS